MANKTTQTKASVSAFLDAIPDAQRRKDAKAVSKLMQAVTGEKPAMWGPSIVGFGKERYQSPATGRGGEWFTAGFSPRKDALTLYLIGGFDQHSTLLEKLGNCKTGKCCLYIKRLDDVDRQALKTLVAKSVKSAKRGDWSY
jgi:hypothetical protein